MPTLKHHGRLLANRWVHHIPKGLVRRFMKSFWQQPRLQDEIGFHVQPYRFESAIPTSLDVDRKKLLERRNLPGIRFDEGVFFEWLGKLQPYASELEKLPVEKTPGAEFCFHNGSFEDFDAATLYAMLRHLKPRRLIEIGCGNSSRVITLACRKNAAEQSPCDSVHIEPYPSESLDINSLPGKFLEKKIQDVPLDMFQTLEANDVLFIDTSHIVKAQSDCCYELLEILPSLKPGVVVHIHDIFTPFDYPAEWLLDDLRPFNEQYALECLLSLTTSFEIILPVYFLSMCHRKKLERLLPKGETRPASFWIQKTIPAKC
jgi:predicted O-methyltransferase YrrM